MSNKYEVWIGGYYHMSGGIRALHVLKDEIIKRGFQAWMKYQSHGDRDCIGVYPEIVCDNPENYTKLSRWLLNTAILPNDGPIFAWQSGMGDYPILTVNIFEMDLWKPSNDQRSGVGYWVGKGVKDPSVIPDGAIEISRNNFPTREQLAHRIKTLDYIISFDAFTAINVEAVLCGTPVLICGQHPVITKEDIVKHNFAPYGVAWTTDELDKARSEVHLAYDHYESLLPIFDKSIDNFLEITQKSFN